MSGRAFVSGVPSNATNKASGEVAQAIFYAEVMKRGLVPLCHYGDNQLWDLVVYKQEPTQFIRVQIKSTHGPTRGFLRWMVRCGRRVKRGYHPSQVDLIALYDFSQGDWYLIPTVDLGGKTSVTLSARQTQWDQYKNNWNPL